MIDLFIERGFAPEWVFGGALVVLAIGLPVVLTTAFMQGGRERAPAAPSDTATTRQLADLFTWRRVIFGGFLAFALLGMATSVYMVMRVTGFGTPGTLAAQGVFEAYIVGAGPTGVLFDAQHLDAAIIPKLLPDILRRSVVTPVVNEYESSVSVSRSQ